MQKCSGTTIDGVLIVYPNRQVDENMKRAHCRDAVLSQKYYFRKEVYRARPRHHTREASAARNRSNTPSRASSPGPNGQNHQRNGQNGHLYESNIVRSSRAGSPDLGPVEEEYSEFTLDEIINGIKDPNDIRGAFPGLVGLVHNYLDSLNVDVETRYELGLYLDLVAARANGECANWRRRL